MADPDRHRGVSTLQVVNGERKKRSASSGRILSEAQRRKDAVSEEGVAALVPRADPVRDQRPDRT